VPQDNSHATAGQPSLRVFGYDKKREFEPKTHQIHGYLTKKRESGNGVDPHTNWSK